MIDSHCHLNADAFADDLDEVVDRAKAAGVHGILVPGIGLEEGRRAVDIARRFPSVRAAVGIHPHGQERQHIGAKQRHPQWHA